MEQKRESMSFDVIIVGAGPAGLSTAIKLALLAKEKNKTLSICILEKGAYVGAHSLSGATFEPNALDELIPNWKELKNHPIKTPATSDEFLFLNKKFSCKIPIPPKMKNHGNYIISSSKLCSWLADYAENLGIQIFPGFAASKPLFDENNAVIGVITVDFGIDKNGNKKNNYQLGMELYAKYTVLAEGARGSITKEIINKFHLDKNSSPQTYGLGIKELWQIPKELHKPGHITHTLGWPLNFKTYGGGFLYHFDENLLSAGFVIGLDYENPYINPYQEFQRFKHHPVIKKFFENGKRISYGARTLNEGGFQSIPKLSFPGGLLVGCSAGLLNNSKIKGIHTAIKSGIIAAKNIFEAITNETNSSKTTENKYDNDKDASTKEFKNAKNTKNQNNIKTLTNYEKDIKNSSIYKELYLARNIRAYFKFGLPIGMFLAGIDTYIFYGRAPFTLKHHADYTKLKPSKNYKPISYPKPDGKISFDILDSIALSATNHEENQPSHLKFKNKNKIIDLNFKIYDSPEQRYCPAKVYEIIKDKNDNVKLQINFTNCLHCKACDIKDPSQNITWSIPEGTGPKYENM